VNDIENGHWEIKDIIAITEILGDPICFHLSVLQDNKDHLGNASHYIETPSHYQVSLCFTWNRIDVFQCYTIVYKQWEEAGKIKNKHKLYHWSCWNIQHVNHLLNTALLKEVWSVIVEIYELWKEKIWAAYVIL